MRAVIGAAEQEAVDWLTVTDHEGIVEGRAYFQTPELLVYETTRPLRPATRYTAQLNNVDDTLAGDFEGGFEWSFETARPALTIVEPVDRAKLVPTDTKIVLAATQDVEIAEFQRRLVVASGDETFAVKVRRPDEGELDGMWTPGERSVLRLSTSPASPPTERKLSTSGSNTPSRSPCTPIAALTGGSPAGIG